MINIKNIRATRKAKVITFTSFGLLGVTLLLTVLVRIALWFDSNRIVFARPVEIEVKFNKVAHVEKREVVKVVEYVGQNDLNKMIETSENPTVAEYIIQKFGPVEGIKALAIAKAESGLREDAMNLNEGRSLDYGIFQVNSVHWSKPGCSLKELVNAYSNIDCAYQIYKQQGGFQAWVAYTNGSWLATLAN